MEKLKNKSTLITGGNSGIGFATAMLFALEGAHVTITGRSAEKGEQAVEMIQSHGGNIQFIAADVRNPEDCQRVANTVEAVDILFNNAGIVTDGTLLTTSLETWLDTLNTNVTGIFNMSRVIVPGMIERGGGVIINNASDWAVVGAQNALAYCTSKGAIANMTRAMALDHARQGIRVNAICPGDTYVSRWHERWGTDDPAVVKERLAVGGEDFPLGRVGHPDDIARAVLFLACDDSSYMTGQLLVVDGGNTAGGISQSFV